jgi:type I restriction enzyme, S subunit
MSFPKYPHYKDSGVEWLGEVPEHWRIDRLKRSTVATKGGVWGAEAQGDSDDLICVRVADFDRQKLEVRLEEPTIRNVAQSERVGRILQPGDLLLEKSGGGEGQPVGCVVLYNHDQLAVCSNFVARLVVADRMSASFWRYYHAGMYAVRLNTRSIKQTSGIQNLDQEQYFDEVAAFPPVGEQESIAAFLDQETAKIDWLITEQQRLIKLLKEKRQAVISHAVTRGLNPDAPMKPSGVEWLGDVPAHWEVTQLRRVIRKGSSITYGIVQAGPHVEDGVPYIKTSDMSGAELPIEGYAKTSTEIDAAYARSRVEAGDLVIAIRASVGKCLRVPPSLAGANLTQGTAKIAPGDHVSGEFLLAYVNSTPVQAYLDSRAKGATFKEITLDALRRTPVLLPPATEQHAISEKITEANRTFGQLIDDAERAIILLQERRTGLISEAVTGKIDVRGIAMEEAA